MWESEVGLMKPTTRQNAGRSVNGIPFGVVNDPAGTDCAVVIVVFGKDNEVRLSQVKACAVPTAPQITIPKSVGRAIPLLLGLSLGDACLGIFISLSFCSLCGFDKPPSVRYAVSVCGGLSSSPRLLKYQPMPHGSS